MESRGVRKVIFASSLGTVFEWYDFYIYATLAPFFATLFFPKGNATAALLASFATYAAGFLVRPFGALVFGRIGDLVGRKYTFLVTIMVMGLATAAVGMLPTYVVDRHAVADHPGAAAPGAGPGARRRVRRRGDLRRRARARQQARAAHQLDPDHGDAGVLRLAGRDRRLPREHARAVVQGLGLADSLPLSLVLLVISVYIRLKLNESPVFLKMKSQGKGSKPPLQDSFTNWANLKIVLLALFGAAAGQGVVWYTGQFYALFFLTGTLKVDWKTAYIVLAVALALGTGLFVFFGWLSDKIGRKKIMMAGCLLGAVTYFPIYRAMTHAANPKLEAFAASTQITVTASNCKMHLFPNPKTVFSECDKVQDLLSKRSLSFDTTDGAEGAKAITKINDVEIVGVDEPKLVATLKSLGYPDKANPEDVNIPVLILLVFIQVVFVTMVYGPIAAFLVELFPARIRYTSMSLPYHIGNGWFGGMLPLTAAALVAAKGNIYAGLWYPVIVAAITFVIGVLFIRETRDHRIGTL